MEILHAYQVAQKRNGHRGFTVLDHMDYWLVAGGRIELPTYGL